MGIGDEYTLRTVAEDEDVTYTLEEDPFLEGTPADMADPVSAEILRYAQEAQTYVENGDADTAVLEDVEEYLDIGSGEQADAFRHSLVEQYTQNGIRPLIESERLRRGVEKTLWDDSKHTIDFSALAEEAAG